MLPPSKIAPLLPGLAGLFFARVLLEGWAALQHTAVSLPIIILTALIAVAAIVWITVQKPLSQTAPLLLLLLYPFFPEPNLPFALGLLGLVLLLLGLPLLQQLPHRLPWEATAVFLTAFSLYLATLAPDLLTADNGEFQWVAAQAGVLHPPGFPLYSIFAFLFAKLPLPLSPAYKITLFSAITSSATLVFVYLTTLHLTHKRLAAFTAVLTLATATTFWAQATTANIRSLTALFAAAAIYSLIHNSQFTIHNSQLRGVRYQVSGVRSNPSNPKPQSPIPNLFLAVLLTTLGVTHHPSIAFFGIIFVIYVLWIDGTVLKSWGRIRPLLLAVTLGLLPLLYLPLRANADAAGAKPSLATWNGFWNHALARGFAGDFFFFVEPAIFVERLRVMGNVLRFQFSPWLLLGMAVGFVLLWRRNKPVAFLLAGTFALLTIVTATYRAPQTVEYMLPAYIPLAILLGITVGKLTIVNCQLSIDNLGRVLLASILFVMALYQGINRFPSFRALTASTDTRTYISTILTDAPLNALVLADWHWFTPLRYAQENEGQRSDLEIRFVSPQGESYGEVWRSRIADGLANGRSVIATHFDPLYATLPNPQPIGEAFLFQNEPVTAMPIQFMPLDQSIGENVQLLGVVMGETAVIGQEIPITVAWQASGETNLYIHLVGFDGQLYAQDDQTVTPNGITLTQFRPVLRPGSHLGAFAFYIGSGSERVQIGNITATAAPFAPITQQRHSLPALDEAKTLVGHDWDQTLPNRTRLYLHWQTPDGFYSTTHDDDAIATVQPTLIGSWGRTIVWSPPSPPRQSHYVPFGRGIVWLGGELLGERPLTPNQSLTPRLDFGSSEPVLRDTAVSVRLIGFEADQFTWAWENLNDSIPALGAIPTLKWIAGSRVTSPHPITVGETATSGQTVDLTLRLYDAFTNRPLPILDERITAQLPWVPVDGNIIE